MIEFIKKNYKYLLIFIFAFLMYYIVNFPSTFRDPLANYGFSHAIINGELPYLDFNLISTPLYAFLMTIGLLIHDSFIIFLIENALLVTIMFYFLDKIFKDKIYILLFLIALLIGDVICPTYNFLALFFFVIIIYLEKEHSNKDLLIGIIIGLAILSKHTIGVFFIIPSIIFLFKDKKRLLKRFLGLLIVGIVFILYLLITNTFNQFFDLCVLGLFDFSSKNGGVMSIWKILCLLLLIVSIVVLIKDKKNILNTYYLLSISFAIPLFDFAHFSLYLFCITMMLLQYININSKLKYVFIVMIILYSSLVAYSFNKTSSAVTIKNINRFNYLRMPNDSYNNTIKYFKFINKYDNSTLLSYSKMIYDISNDKKIDYFDVLLYGNHGINGTNKMINMISKTHDHYYIVDNQTYDAEFKTSQFNKEIVDYVINNCELIESKYIFDVYYKK